jgi:hypothetical protein
METIILFAPLVGAIIAGFGWRIIGDAAAQWVTTGLLFLACIAELGRVPWHRWESTQYITSLFDWIESGHAGYRLGDPARPADGDHADRGDHRLRARAPLFLRLHGP